MQSEPRKPAGAPDEERRLPGTPEEGRSPAGTPNGEQGGDHPAAPGGESEDASVSDASRPDGSEEAAGRVDADLDELLEETKRERDEYLELAQRTKADFENYRKRMAAEAERASQRGKAQLAGELIGVIDNLERALAAAGVEPDAALAGEVEVDGALEQGALLTYRELHSTLARAGIEAYDPSGEKFDPEWHEALSTRAADGTDPGVVLEVVSKGYRLDGKVIRAAQVVVSE
jgi:molecular chaperone GrpE